MKIWFSIGNILWHSRNKVDMFLRNMMANKTLYIVIPSMWKDYIIIKSQTSESSTYHYNDCIWRLLCFLRNVETVI